MSKTTKNSRLPSLHLTQQLMAIPFIFILSSALLLGSPPTKASAADAEQKSQNTTTQQSTDTFSSLKDISNQIDSFISDVKGFVQNEVFGSLNQILQSTIGAIKIPDLGDLVQQIMKGDELPEAGQTANQWENNLPNSYAIRQEVARASERAAAIGVAQGETLSKEAQQKSEQVRQQSATAASEAEQMAQDSETTDTSQQILRNVSQQLKDSAAIANLQLQEAQQARTDRALSLTLEAQAAKELSEANTRERQEAIAQTNGAAFYTGLISVPGGVVLDRDSSTSAK
jgi:hypothetical protein